MSVDCSTSKVLIKSKKFSRQLLQAGDTQAYVVRNCSPTALLLSHPLTAGCIDIPPCMSGQVECARLECCLLTPDCSCHATPGSTLHVVTALNCVGRGRASRHKELLTNDRGCCNSLQNTRKASNNTRKCH